MPRTRPPYPPEFRIEAVRMLRAVVRSPRQLAAELGCSEQTLRNWWRQDEADRGERDDVLSSEERQRLRELERENRVLRQEREILKRAAAFMWSARLCGPGRRPCVFRLLSAGGGLGRGPHNQRASRKASSVSGGR